MSTDVVVKGEVAQVKTETIGRHTLGELIVDQLLGEGRARPVSVFVPSKFAAMLRRLAPGQQVAIAGHMEVGQSKLVDGELSIGTQVVATTLELEQS